jgi:hypothetical protein
MLWLVKWKVDELAKHQKHSAISFKNVKKSFCSFTELQFDEIALHRKILGKILTLRPGANIIKLFCP